MTSTTVKLPDTLINEARRYASVHSRSTPKQLEHWMKIGKMAEENPDLSYTFLKDLLLGMQEADEGDVTPYRFGK